MSANIAQKQDGTGMAAYANTAAWHNEGVVLDTGGAKGMTIIQALDASGLDWTVAKCPIYAANPFDEIAGRKTEIEGRYGVQRQTDGKILGVVGNTWEPVQNIEGFALIQDFMQESDAFIEAAGALDGGKKVWVLAHMPSELMIAGEAIEQYVLFANGHDGRTAVTALMTDIRVVCQNTLSWAMDSASKVHRVRHTNKATEKLAEAKHILGMRDKRAEELAKQGEWLVNKEMSDKQFDNFLEKLMPISEEAEGTPADTMITGRRDEVRSLYKTAENLNNVRGTRWGALNAAVEYSDYGRKFKDGESQMKSQVGMTAAPLKDRAYQLLTV